MNYSEAKAFIEKIYMIWVSGTIDQLSLVYDQQIEAYYFGQPHVCFNDIENRFHYARKHYKNPKFTLHDLVVDDHKIAVRSAYEAVGQEGNLINLETIAIFYMNASGKIYKLWSMSDKPVNYLEKS